MDIIKTDIYPTRYTAFDNPGKWAIFEPAEDGTYRSCREDGPRLPASGLGASKEYPGEMAVLVLPEKNREYPHLTDGFYIEIGGSETLGFWGDDEPPGFRANCHYTAPTKAREQKNAVLRAATREDAMKAAEEWVEHVRDYQHVEDLLCAFWEGGL